MKGMQAQRCPPERGERPWARARLRQRMRCTGPNRAPSPASASALSSTGLKGLRRRFFGSAKGCSNSSCSFNHDDPNSVVWCSYQQQGMCDKGDACTFRHEMWQSAGEAEAFYASRTAGTVQQSSLRYQQVRRQLGRDGRAAPSSTVASEHVELEGIIEKDFQEGCR